MNSTWHIIKKDLYQFRWALACWLGCYLYIFLIQGKADFHQNIDLRDAIRFTVAPIAVVLSVGMLIGIIQQDHPTDSRAFWRTRPISPGHLVATKLGLVLVLYVIVPLLIVLLGQWLRHTVLLQTPREYALLISVLVCTSFSWVAAAACTRSIMQCLAFWSAAVFGSALLADLLSRYMPKLSLRLSLEMNLNRGLTILALSVLFSLAIILNQYLRRRLSASIILMAVGSVGVALVGVLWSYYYFYQG